MHGDNMILCLIGHDFRYELEKLIRLFLPFEKQEFSDTENREGNRAVTVLSGDTVKSSASARLYLEGQCYLSEYTFDDNSATDPKEWERLLALALFDCFVKASGYEPPWGILTGVRPAKLFSRLTSVQGEEKAEQWFSDALRVKPNKIALCRDTVQGENAITSLSKSDSFSLYVSIPFCPTRCAYCSFVSHSIASAKKQIPVYLNLLKEELSYTGEIAKRLGLRLETVYIGGGTPTALSAEEISELMCAIKDHFDFSHLREFTVEAGRPDTLTKEKLEAIKQNGCTRISVNPQTMNDTVLKEIGREHTAKQTEDAFELARKCGFSNINMDLIAGLPTDDFASFQNTMNRVLALHPESVTMHTLSMKRASYLSLQHAFPAAESGRTAEQMVEFAREILNQNGYLPYYMYRQSKTVGNLENVGYAKPGFEGLYNVYTMDETHTILSCGASAFTKLREPNGPYIERIFNFKYPYEYVDRFEELQKRKDAIFTFYEKYPLEDK